MRWQSLQLYCNQTDLTCPRQPTAGRSLSGHWHTPHTLLVSRANRSMSIDECNRLRSCSLVSLALSRQPSASMELHKHQRTLVTLGERLFLVANKANICHYLSSLRYRHDARSSLRTSQQLLGAHSGTAGMTPILCDGLLSGIDLFAPVNGIIKLVSPSNWHVIGRTVCHD